MRIDTEQLETGYLNLKAQTLRQNDRLADLMNLNSDPVVKKEVNDQIIERAVKSLLDDHKQRFEDLMALKEKFAISEKVRADDEIKVATRYAKLETEFEEYRTKMNRREDQIKSSFDAKEKEIR